MTSLKIWFITNLVLILDWYGACDIVIVYSGGKYAHVIYKYVSMALDKSIQHSRYEMPRAALQLLAKHACQWDQCIIDDYKVSIIPCSFYVGHVLFR